MRVYFAQNRLTTGCRAVSTYCIMNSVHASRYYNVYILNDDQNLANRRANVRKCKYQFKDKFRLLHSKYFQINKNNKDKTYFFVIIIK